MRVVYERCCGLDVHKKSVVACVLITPETGAVQRHLRTFSTMTAGLLALADWLESLQIPVVAMESTGVYWRPVFNVLEEGRTIILVNAQHMKAVPGRKTDIKDSEWIADLTRSRPPQSQLYSPAPIRELRDLTRYRKTLIQERTEGGSTACEMRPRNGECEAGGGGETMSSVRADERCWRRWWLGPRMRRG